MVVIGHGIDGTSCTVARPRARLAPGLPPFDPLLGVVGRLSPEKGQAVPVRALPAILAAFPRAGLVLAGGGPSPPALAAGALRPGIADPPLFLGVRRGVPAPLGALCPFE